MLKRILNAKRALKKECVSVSFLALFAVSTFGAAFAQEQDLAPKGAASAGQPAQTIQDTTQAQSTTDQAAQPGATPLPPYLVTLNDAQFIDDSRFGDKSETRLAFDQALKAGSSIRQELQWMVENGRPTGRIYAAIVFRSFDKPGGRELLERLKSDTNLIKYKKGGEICHYSVGDVAQDALSSKPIIGFGVDLSAAQR